MQFPTTTSADGQPRCARVPTAAPDRHTVIIYARVCSQPIASRAGHPAAFSPAHLVPRDGIAHVEEAGSREGGGEREAQESLQVSKRQQERRIVNSELLAANKSSLRTRAVQARTKNR